MVDRIRYPTVSYLPFVRIITFLSLSFNLYFLKFWSETSLYWRQRTYSQTWSVASEGPACTRGAAALASRGGSSYPSQRTLLIAFNCDTKRIHTFLRMSFSGIYIYIYIYITCYRQLRSVTIELIRCASVNLFFFC